MVKQKLPKYGKWKRGLIYFNRRVPKKYLKVPPFDRYSEVIEWSTNASDFGIGLKKLAEHIIRFEKMLDEAENQSKHKIGFEKSFQEPTKTFIEPSSPWLKTLSQKKAEKIALSVFLDFLETYERRKKIADTGTVNEKAMLRDFEEYEVANYNSNEWLDSLEYEPQKTMREEALALLVKNGYIERLKNYRPTGQAAMFWEHPVEATIEFNSLCSLLAKAHLDIGGKIEELKKTRLLSLIPKTPELLLVFNDQVDPDEITLRNVTKQYKKFNSKTTPGWLKQVDRVVDAAIEFSIPEDIREIKRVHIKKFMDELRNCPANATQRFPGKTISEAIELNKKLDHPVLSPNSIKHKWLAPLKAVFNYAIERDLITANPTHRLKIENAKKQPRRVIFDTDELNKLLHTPWFTGCFADRAGATLKTGKVIINDHRYWGCLLALFTGARTAEIAQLRLKDFQIEGNIPNLRISNDGNQKLKTENAVRRVPIHSTLIELGFLTYLIDMKSKNCDRAFPYWEMPDEKGYAQSSSQRTFNRYLVPLISQKTNPRPVFHSFRNTIKTEMLEEGVPPQHQKILLGHSLDPMDDIYTGEVKLETLKFSIEKVKYRGVDFSHLVGSRYPKLKQH